MTTDVTETVVKRFIIVDEPGYTPQKKTPLGGRDGAAQMMRELRWYHPDARLTLCELTWDNDLWVVSEAEVMSTDEWGRLFVPLSTDPFRWFQDGHKTWEMRTRKGPYHKGNIRVGRRVELRRGYSTPDSLWGAVAEVIEADSIHEFFERVDWDQVICDPFIFTRDEAEAQAAKILKTPANGWPVIGFRVALDRDGPQAGATITGRLPMEADRPEPAQSEEKPVDIIAE